MMLYGFTRQYATQTGAALHLALGDGQTMTALNGGFGILFPKADFSENTFVGRARGLRCPWMLRLADGSFCVAALPCTPADNGHAVPEEGHAHEVLLFTSPDMIRYEELKPVAAAPAGTIITDVRGACIEGRLVLSVCYDGAWHALVSDMLTGFVPCEAIPIPERIAVQCPDAAPGCCMEITEEEAAALRMRFISPRLPEHAERFPFPLMPERGDPMAIRWQDGYLFMATDDECGQRRLLIRQTKHLAEIPAAQDHVLFTSPDEGDYSGCLWAPELHVVNGRLCIFFAAGMPHWYTVQSRVMWLNGDDPTDAACWSAPKRMERMDGTWLTHDGISITLDMTVLNTAGGLYVVWSQRPIHTEPIRCGTADLYIARLNPEAPWKLASEPVLLTRPEYGWERIHSEVCEGPFLLKKHGTLYLTYACALIDHTYAVGVLTARDGDELLDTASWRKENYPLLHRMSMPDQLGGGHNAFVQDEDGNDVITLHALSKAGYLHDPGDGRRFPAFRQVVWDEKGFPHLDAHD